MKILIAVVVLTVLALAGSWGRLTPRAIPRAVRLATANGGFIVIGLILGSEFLNLIDAGTLDRMQPFVCVALGWVGFLFGLQFDRRTVQHLPHGFAAIAASVSAVTMLFVIPPMWKISNGIWHGGVVVGTLAVITLAAAAACTGQAAVAVADRHRGPRSRHVMTLLRYISSLDPVAGVVVFGLAVSILGRHPVGTGWFGWTLQWPLVAVALGCLTAWIFVSLTLTRTSQAELVLYLLGLVALSSGIALGLGLSVIFVSSLCGVVVANLAHVRSIRPRVMNLMVASEHFLYLCLLVVAGAYWRLPTAWIAVAAIVYAGSRLAGKIAGGFIATRGLARQHEVPPLVGLGLVSQGGMGLAILIEYRLLVDDPVGEIALGIGVGAVLLNELAAPFLTQQVAGGGRGRDE
jgi:hypothetical protein